MSFEFQVVIDCKDPARMARFWAAALGYEIAPPPAGFANWDDYWRDVGVPEDELGAGPDRLVDPSGRDPAFGFKWWTRRRRSRTGSTSTLRRAADEALPWRCGDSGWRPRRGDCPVRVRRGSASCSRKESITTPWRCWTRKATSSTSTDHSRNLDPMGRIAVLSERCGTPEESRTGEPHEVERVAENA